MRSGALDRGWDVVVIRLVRIDLRCEYSVLRTVFLVVVVVVLLRGDLLPACNTCKAFFEAEIEASELAPFTIHPSPCHFNLVVVPHRA